LQVNSTNETELDRRYYEVATPGSLAERLAARARERIYRDFLTLTRADRDRSLLDVGVSDVVGDAANHLERMYPHPERITAAGLGEGAAFRAAFPMVRYVRIEAGKGLPFADREFDIAASNAVLEHVGSEAGQRAFLAELARVARTVFVSVPHRYFPVEHHTGIPFLHWTDGSFRLACRATGKTTWAQPENLILMTRQRLRALWPNGGNIGATGLRLGPFSSNLYLFIEPPR